MTIARDKLIERIRAYLERDEQVQAIFPARPELSRR
jgi:hypothetical protein